MKGMVINMKTFVYTVKDEHGIHARPAGVLISCAKKFASDIRICKISDVGHENREEDDEGKMCGKEADGKRLLSVMSLGARFGDKLRFTVSGIDESEAAAELQKCCYENIGR